MTDNQKVAAEEKLFLMLKLDKDRRRWRLLAWVTFIVLLFVISANNDKKQEEVQKKENYIAEIKIDGVIFEDDYRMQRLEKLAKEENVKAVILTIDSPGGSMVPGLEILDSLRDLAKEKPLVVQMKTVAASAGFLISLSGEYVVANKATLTGSVGVLMPLVDATELSKKIGIKSAEIASGDLKSITSPLTKRTDKAQNYLQATVDELQEIFMKEVKLRRDISKEVEKTISDGRVLIGQKALDYGLIDAIGGKKQLLGYLHEQKDISKDLKVVEYSLKKPEKVKFQDILADQLTSKISNEISAMFATSRAIPMMQAN
jgi:protease-4